MSNGLGKAMSWAAIGRFGNMGIMFIANIVLARLLTPAEFGTMGILLVFIGFSDIFIDGGLTSALIQKGKPTKDDFSSVFYFNVCVSVVCYLLVFIFSPSISNYFKDPYLTDTLRVIGLILIFNAVGVIQITQLNISLSFKKLARYKIISTIIGTTVAIILALIGFGVWSLVYRNLISAIILNVMAWLGSEWRPLLHFSLNNIKTLYRFGGFMFLSTLFEYIYAYIQPVIIGRYFSVNELGYYSQARKIEEIPSNSLSGIVTSVAFPVLSKIKNDEDQFRFIVKNSLEKISFISFPIMIWMVALSFYIISVLFGEKWLGAVPLLEILAIAGIFRIPSALNMCIIQSRGKSKAFLFIQLTKRCLGIGCVLIGAFFGLFGLMWGFVVGSAVFFLIDSIMVGKYINYGTAKQIKDMGPIIFICAISYFGCYLVKNYITLSSNILTLIVLSIIFAAFYIGSAFLIRLNTLKYYNQKFKTYLIRRNK